MKEKSEAFQKFKAWCKAVEVEKGHGLKCLRTDNGLEFLSNEFEDFCRDKGIRRHRTAPANPQQNGTAERMNMTFLERVRCMMITSGTPKKFWAEAVSTAAKLINKCPSSVIQFDTPDNKWYGSPGNYSKLKVFGCRAYVHARQGKLDARALKCIFLGYQTVVKGYRLWCIEVGKQKIMISRDVVFVESEMPYLQAANPNPQEGEESGNISMDPGGSAPDIDENIEPEDSVQLESEASEELHEPVDTYLLARDRTRRNIRPPTKFSDSDFVYYALCVAEELELNEPRKATPDCLLLFL